ncbi:adenylate/guanylate cyclase domain-containing protein [Actinomadura bangladeshensis]|uniref:Adenylate/guanylate cyclase domain-containing protein n=1 Tax=Actinomadura bangladeshensis TaxID=453573 RepID=A0A4R4PE28_9ACTN|nr:adenylate/guanylate cyclase domain-containing protein [Actinomadura bangladeshensis]
MIPFGGLIPPEARVTSRLEIRVRWVLLVVVGVANVVGALVVLLFATFVVPDPPLDDRDYVHMVNAVAFFSYPVVAAPVALVLGLWLWRPVVTFVRDGGEPGREQRRAVLLGPLRLTLLIGAMWTVGALGWAVLDLVLFTGRLAVKTGLTCLLGAATTCTIVYLLSERLLRPAAALVLGAERPKRFRLPGVTTRVMLAWALGTAIPVFGLICVAIAALAAPDINVEQLAITILGLGGVALLAGVYVIYMATRAIADPIKAVRKGMAQVERGDLGAEVAVYDASEVGQLQAGFNHMVAGLRENERLRDLFGRHVGEEVADLALERGAITLGGETREVAVLFVDLTGSTRLADTRSPDEVVGLLNRFFGVVVTVVAKHGGWINKFEGDAALAIFGAPTRTEDSAGGALGAARELAVRLRAEVPMLDAGIGVSAGPVVAGYIGAEERFEYTVIGDPVNEAARLSDLAKGEAGRVLASAAVLDLAHLAEAGEWDVGRSVTLRGRSRPTRLGTPRRSAPVAEPEAEPALDAERPVRRVRFPRPLRRSRRLLVGALILSKAAKSARTPDKSEESE